MSAYIKGMGTISPQETWSNIDCLANALNYTGNQLKCVEPDYTQWINPQQLRRMSRVLKIGTTAALIAMKNAEIENVDGIITGTALGCLEDTGAFLTKLIERNEDALNPTPFMQSTHNTIGSQIALLLQCKGYNQTFTQGAFSFEHALLDTLMQLEDNSDQTFLTGGVDEITPLSHQIQSRFNKYRSDSADSLQLLKSPKKGTVAGEGAAYFALCGKRDERSLVCVKGVHTYSQLADELQPSAITSFLRNYNFTASDIDLVLVGKNGDENFGQRFDAITDTLFKGSSIGGFKHLCGEYGVASSFALWLGATILSTDNIPPTVLLQDASRPVKSVLIYNSYFKDHHTLILLTHVSI